MPWLGAGLVLNPHVRAALVSLTAIAASRRRPPTWFRSLCGRCGCGGGGELPQHKLSRSLCLASRRPSHRRAMPIVLCHVGLLSRRRFSLP